MGFILNIETATKNCSVSLSNNGQLLTIKELNDANYSHAEKLHLFIEDVLSEANVELNQLVAIAVSKGPGSYTGLRIGVSAAKGLCYALDIPLISIETLKSLATKVSTNNAYIVPMIDARRMEVYSSVYNKDFNEIRGIQAEIIDENSFNEILDKRKVYFIGDGAAKCMDVITNTNACFIEGEYPSAKEMAILSYNKFSQNDFENVAYFEPFYLKDFIAVPAKKKV